MAFAPASITTLSQREGGRFPALDGLRAVAVGVVMADHYGWGLPGDLGVSAFFVLSGFLITSLLMEEHITDGTVSLRRFYMRRTLRIFPAYYVFLLFSFTLDYFLQGPWPVSLRWAAVGYGVNYYNAITGTHAGTVAHAWSLAVEEQFYLLWPALFLLLMRWGRATAVRSLAVIIGLVVLWRSGLYLIAHVGNTWVYNAFDCRFDILAVGCALALLIHDRKAARVADKLAWAPWAPIVTLAALVFSRMHIGERYHYSIGFTVDALLLAVLVVQLMALSRHPLWRWIEHPITRWLGLISYPLYLYHLWGDAFGRHLPAGLTSLRPVVSVAMTIALAAASYYVVERPFLRLKKRFERARSAPASA